MNENGALPFFDLALRSFEQARAAAGGGGDRQYEIGGRRLYLRTAGPALSPLLTPALDHLERTQSGLNSLGLLFPDLTLLAWDSASIGTLPLDFSWIGHNPDSSRVRLYNHWNGVHVLYDHANGAVSLYHEAQRTACFWIDSAERLSFAECAAPFRAIFQWWMSGQGRLLVHSASVGLGDQGVLILGGEGSGKSTTAALCLRNGLLLAGDDYVVLSPGPPDYVDSVYSSLKLTPESLAAMPDLTRSVRSIGWPGFDKSVLYLAPDYQTALAPRFKLRAALLPSLSGRNRTMIRPATAADGIRALAPSTLFIQIADRKRAFGILAAFIRRTPCYTLELGRDFASVSTAVEEFLRGTCS